MAVVVVEPGVSSGELEGAEGIERKQVSKGQEKETYNRLGKKYEKYKQK